jgi:hypothetical protein
MRSVLSTGRSRVPAVGFGECDGLRPEVVVGECLPGAGAVWRRAGRGGGSRAGRRRLHARLRRTVRGGRCGAVAGHRGDRFVVEEQDRGEPHTYAVVDAVGLQVAQVHSWVRGSSRHAGGMA